MNTVRVEIQGQIQHLEQNNFPKQLVGDGEHKGVSPQVRKNHLAGGYAVSAQSPPGRCTAILSFQRRYIDDFAAYQNRQLPPNNSTPASPSSRRPKSLDFQKKCPILDDKMPAQLEPNTIHGTLTHALRDLKSSLSYQDPIYNIPIQEVKSCSL